MSNESIPIRWIRAYQWRYIGQWKAASLDCMLEEWRKTQAKEIITCKDCLYWDSGQHMCKHEKTMDGSIMCLECDEDFYCGYAVRQVEGL